MLPFENGCRQRRRNAHRIHVVALAHQLPENRIGLAALLDRGRCDKGRASLAKSKPAVMISSCSKSMPTFFRKVLRRSNSS
jgi:hypothetical protein